MNPRLASIRWPAPAIEDLIVRTGDVAGGSSVVVSHVMSTILRSAQRVALLYDGRLQWLAASPTSSTPITPMLPSSGAVA
jgi:phospholipid/cholesterol/gamma-HCH transport system ATP-binding protein